MIFKQLKIKISLNESVKDQTRCPAIQGFVRSVPNFDWTLSVDRPYLENEDLENEDLENEDLENEDPRKGRPRKRQRSSRR